MHLTLSLSISYPDLIKFHDFADNGQDSRKCRMRGATQAEQDMTLLITLIIKKKFRLQIMGQVFHFSKHNKVICKVRRLGGENGQLQHNRAANA